MKITMCRTYRPLQARRKYRPNQAITLKTFTGKCSYNMHIKVVAITFLVVDYVSDINFY